jgi:CheY-like chemotaxis protein
MGSGASRPGKVTTGLTKLVKSSVKGNKENANDGNALTTSGKVNHSKDVRRASFIPVSEANKVKSAKTEDEQSAVHADEALKVTIHNDASRRAFMKFLQRTSHGQDHVLNYYFEIDDIKSTKNDDVIDKARALHARYASYAVTATEGLRPVWKTILDMTQPLPNESSLDPDEAISAVLEQLKTAQAFIVSTLSPKLAEFYLSDCYKEFENAKSHQEGALLRPSISNQPGTGSAGPAASVQLPNNTYPKHFSKILVVDDSSVATKVSMLALKKNGHDVKVAPNGRKCIELCEVEAFDVVLVDLYMPIMDGFETMMALKANKVTESSSTEEAKKEKFPVVIAMSADWDKESEEKAISCGADSFLEKPFTVEKLSVILVKFLPSSG